MTRRWLAALVLAAGCASAPIRPTDQTALDAAAALVRPGCYECLLEARDTYARVAVGRARPLVLPRLFEVEVLLALREKELARDASGPRERAVALTGELPTALDGERIVRIVDAVLPDAVGVSRTRMDGLRQAPAHRDVDVDAEVAWLRAAPLSVPVRQYVSAALECSYEFRPSRPGEPRRRSAKPEPPPDITPLVAYRIATCFAIATRELEALAAAEPRFVDTMAFSSRTAVIMAEQDGGARAREQLEPVYERFPDSPSVTYLFGNLEQIVGDCEAALRLYAETLELEPGHEGGSLGRTICLSHLGRNAEAIESATSLIGLGTYTLSDGYYWRAWNRHATGRLELARADIESAKAIAATGQIFTLAGIIEHDQADLDIAKTDLTSARSMSAGSRNCTAAWYLGLVHMRQEAFGLSSEAFEQAMDCYERNVAESESKRQSVEPRIDLDPAYKARQLAALQTAIDRDRGQFFAAAFNVANQAAQAGARDRALRFLAVAEKGTDPALVKLVSQLRALLRVPS